MPTDPPEIVNLETEPSDEPDRPEDLIAATANAEISIDGKRVDKEFEIDIHSVKLDQYIDNHHVLQIRLRRTGSAGENDFDDLSHYSDMLGKTISLDIEAESYESSTGSVKAKLFIGLITEVRMDGSINGINVVRIVAHSPTITLDSAPRNRIVGLNMKLPDIVGKVLGDYKITKGRISAGPVCTDGEKHNKEVDSNIQFGETDWAYIQRIASENSFFAFYDGTAFNVEKAGTNNEQKLSFRQNLGSFSLGVGTGPLKYKGQVWDPVKKEIVSGEADKGKLRGATGPFSGKAISSSDEIYETRGTSPAPKHGIQANVDTAVTREVESTAGQMMIGKGVSNFPKVQVGSAVVIDGLGKADGKYWITSIVHSFFVGSYYNKFTCVPMEMAYPKIRYEQQHFGHFQVGVVTDNLDPENLGRVKVRLAWHSSEEETQFLRLLTYDGGKERGWFALPEIDDEVLVAYERGNSNAPVVLGCLYNGKDKPPKSNSDVVVGGKVETKIYRTRNGNELVFVDKDGAETITICQKDGTNTIVLNMDGPKIVIESTGDILMKGKTISLESTTGDISIKSKGKLIGEAQSDIQLKATANFKSEGGMNYEAKGGIGFKASGTQANLEGSAMTTIKGGIVKIN